MSVFTWTGTTDTGYATAGNYTPGGPPGTSGDTLILNQLATKEIAGSDQSATTLAALNSLSTNTQEVGDDGVPLKIGVSKLRIGDLDASGQDATGSPRINLDLSTVAANIVIVSTSQATADTGKEPVRIKGVNASTVATIQSGTVGFATDLPGDVATLGQIVVVGTSANVNLGAGVTLTTLLLTDGNVRTSSGVTTIRQTGGTLATQGTGGITTLNITGGTATLNSVGTIGTLIVGADGTADFTQDGTPKTVSNCKLYAGATLKITPGVTFSTPIQCIECDWSDINLVTGGNFSVVPAYL